MIRELAIELLCDELGISNDAWPLLFQMLEADPDNDNSDIVAALDGGENRVWLPESFPR